MLIQKRLFLIINFPKSRSANCVFPSQLPNIKWNPLLSWLNLYETKAHRGLMSFLRPHVKIEQPQHFPTGTQIRILGQNPESGTRGLFSLVERTVRQGLLHFMWATPSYRSFCREQQAVFRALRNNCAFQTKTPFRKMIQIWAVCSAGFGGTFPFKMSLCAFKRSGINLTHD